MQKYISKELTHFVGRGLSEEEQYLLLVHILTTGWLTHYPHFLDMYPYLEIKTQGSISRNEMYNPKVICFCDIPVKELGIHMNKYSHFGLSFLKTFLIKKGANPVLYMAKNSIGGHHVGGYYNRVKKFDNVMRMYHELSSLVDDALSRTEGKGRHPPNETQMYSDVQWFLDHDILSFVKVFDDSLPDNDPDNYYMEREWRMVGHLKFGLGDVYRVIIPKLYYSRFKKDVPTYKGYLYYS